MAKIIQTIGEIFSDLTGILQLIGFALLLYAGFAYGLSYLRTKLELSNSFSKSQRRSRDAITYMISTANLVSNSTIMQDPNIHPPTETYVKIDHEGHMCYFIRRPIKDELKQEGCPKYFVNKYIPYISYTVQTMDMFVAAGGGGGAGGGASNSCCIAMINTVSDYLAGKTVKQVMHQPTSIKIGFDPNTCAMSIDNRINTDIEMDDDGIMHDIVVTCLFEIAIIPECDNVNEYITEHIYDIICGTTATTGNLFIVTPAKDGTDIIGEVYYISLMSHEKKIAKYNKKWFEDFVAAHMDRDTRDKFYSTVYSKHMSKYRVSHTNHYTR